MSRILKALAAIMLITATLFAVGCKKEKKAEVETSQVTNLTSSSATAGGVVTSDGGSSVVERGVCWSKSSMPTVGDNHLTSGTGVGSFTCDITGLEAATTYYVRAYAINNVGIGYGSQSTFTTLTSGGNGGGGGGGGGNPADLPVVTTSEVTNITGSSAKGGGDVVSNGASNVTDRGICWSTDHNPTVEGNHISCGTGTGSFIADMTDLTLETTYYVRAYAMNAAGTAYGAEVSFVTVNPSGVPVGAICGVFNAGQRFVYFSKGNLQYQPSSNTWRFAEHQYDCIGAQNQYVSSYYNGWIDLFGWGTSGYNHGATAYQPWNTSTNSSEYYAYGNASYNLSDQTGQADWGYNAISNGGNTTNIWNTLTKDEWVYLFNARYTSSNIRYAKATIEDVAGVILLPDDWNPSTFGLYQTNNATTSFWANMLSASEWSVLEEAGAVFLPCAGIRTGFDVYGYGGEYGGDGRYWSSSVYNDSNAFFVFFNYDSYYGGHLNPQNYVNRHHALSVRLVQTVNNR